MQGLVAEYFQLLSDSRSLDTYNLPKARNTPQTLKTKISLFYYNTMTQMFIPLIIHRIISIILVNIHSIFSSIFTELYIQSLVKDITKFLWKAVQSNIH